MQDDQRRAAVARCQEEIRRRPEKALGYARLGKVHAQAQEYHHAETMLKKAIAKAPSWQVPYNSLAKLYLAQGKQTRAIAELETLKDKTPGNMATYILLAILYEKSGDGAKARQTYRQLLERDPKSWVAANNLAFLISRDAADPAELDEALNLARTANRLRPGDGVVLDTLGRVHYRRGELGPALTNLEAALEKAPESPVVNYHAAVVLHESGRSDEAREKIVRALADDQPFPGREAAEKLKSRLM